MRQTECQFEADVLESAVLSAELREHVKSCEICADLLAVAGAVEAAREETVAYAIPDSGLVWWKAQIRARREAAEAVGRPITAVQIAAFACAVGLMGACIGATSSWFQAALKWAWSGITGIDVKAFVPYATALIEGHGLLAACMVAMVFVVPVAVYLVVGKE